jgi:hypothetical protein
MIEARSGAEWLLPISLMKDRSILTRRAGRSRSRLRDD